MVTRLRLPLTSAWFWLALVLGLFLRAIPLLEKQYFTGDELRAYLAATAHQGEYRQLVREGTPLIGEWATAQEWTRLVRPEPEKGLQAVAQDLAWYDVHPPFYFWLLHLWSRVVGVTFGAGALLNLLGEGLILALLLIWGRQRPGSAAIAGWSSKDASHLTDARWLAAIWWLSPVVIRVSSLTRQYVFLTLITLLYAYTFDQLFYQSSPRRAKLWSAGLLSGLFLLGMLTHYLFALVIGTSVVALAIKYRGSYHRWLLYLLPPLAIAAAVFVWIYPDFFVAFTFLREARPDFSSGMTGRLGRSLIVSLALYVPILLSWLYLSITAQFSRPRPEQRAHILFALLPMLGVVLLYLLLISPHHAMGPQYVLFCTPFVAWLALLLLNRTPSSRRLLPTLLLTLVTLNFLLLHPTLRNFGFSPRLGPTALATDGVLVFDHPASIHWLNFALHLPDEQPVFVAAQADLLAQPEHWLPRLRAEGGLYLAWTLLNPQKQGATTAEQARLLALIERNAQVTLRATVRPLALGELRIFQIAPR